MPLFGSPGANRPAPNDSNPDSPQRCGATSWGHGGTAATTCYNCTSNAEEHQLFLSPVKPPYDPLEWERAPFPEKSRLVCLAWALQGYGTPIAVYIAYVFKVLLYIAGWVFFCSFTPGMGGLGSIASWWLRPEAFQKAVLWSMLFEVLGLGCGSGPLTGRYMPPLGGALYFLRRGTTKLPALPGAAIIGETRRGLLDVSLYAAMCIVIVVALVSARPAVGVLIAIAVLVPALGLLDKTLFLAARGEHYWTTLMVFVLASNFVPGAKLVQASLWFWAGVSKLNHHFPAVVCVMTSNSPVIRLQSFRRLMYRSFPDDLSPSRPAVLISYAGTALEFSVPALLLAGRGGGLTVAGLILMLVLHAFATVNVPMGVPLEWNVLMVYGGFFLFWEHAGEGLAGLTAPVLALVAVMCVLVPLLGNLLPSRISFLLAMRYYAGNWAYSVWLFKGESYRKLDRLTKSSAWIHDQLQRFYDRATSVAIFGKVMGFRLMHLHGRALPLLLPKAVPRIEDYEWVDGEAIAGMALGWNFGDGHLHNEQLLRSLQQQCEFDAGELRCIMVESQPLAQHTLSYRIVDAAQGLLESGVVDVRRLRSLQPWELAASQGERPQQPLGGLDPGVLAEAAGHTR
jgi:Transmembrane protein of unknown function (DUF3556)